MVFQSFPLAQIHPFAFKAAAYGYCVEKQKNDAFFTYAAAVFDTQAALTAETGDATLKNAVTKAGLDPAAIDACAATQATKDQVNASIKLAEDVGVNQTPMLAVNGHLLPISQVPYETLKKIIAYQAQLDGVSTGATALQLLLASNLCWQVDLKGRSALRAHLLWMPAQVFIAMRRRRRSFHSGEDDGLVGVGEDAVVEVPADGAREDEALEVAALLDEVGELVVLRDAGDVLLDDGAFVEDLGDVVAGGADELDAAREGRVVGPRSGEGGQKRVVDVDDALRVGADELGREHLHVAGEDDEVDGVGGEQGKLLLLRPAALLAAVTGM